MSRAGRQTWGENPGVILNDRWPSFTPSKTLRAPPLKIGRLTPKGSRIVFKASIFRADMLVSGRAFRIVRFESSVWTSHACARRSAGDKIQVYPENMTFSSFVFSRCPPKNWGFHRLFFTKTIMENLGECALDEFLPKVRYGQSSKEGPIHHLVFVWLCLVGDFFMGSTMCKSPYCSNLSHGVRSFWWHSGPLGTQNSP